MPMAEYRGMASRMANRRFNRAEEYNPSQEERDAYSLLRQRFDPMNAHRAQLERRWHHNLAFLAGAQWHTFDTHRWAMTAPSEGTRWRLRSSRNYILPHHERTLSQMTGFTPKFQVRPNSPDVEDIQASRTGSQLCQHSYHHLEMPTIWRNACSWASATGTGFLKVNWNHYGGRRYSDWAVDYDGNLMVDDDGIPYQEEYAQGDLMNYAPSPFSIQVDPLATEDRDCEWMMEVNRRPLTWVDRYYPEKSKFVTTDHASSSDDPLRRHRTGYQVAGTGGMGTLIEHETAQEWVTVYEYYEKPSPKYPKGRLIIGANNVILQMGDNPTPDGGFPYIPIRKIEIPGSYWGHTEVHDLIGPQRDYNKIVTKRMEHLLLFGLNLKVLFPQGGGMPQSSWVSRLGETVKFNGPVPPQYLQPPPLPPESEQEMLRFKGDFDAITNTHGAQRGQYQGKLSGKAINLLVEQGFKAQEPMLRRLATALTRWAELVLLNFQEFADEEHIIKVQGKDSMFDVHSFKGADIKGNTDVFVEIDSMRPKSRTMAIEDLGIMANTGLLNMMDPKDKAKAFKMLEMEDNIESVTYDAERDRRIAQFENGALLRGEFIPPPEPTDDNDIHEEEHRATMNSDRWRALSAAEQEPMRKHYQEHLDAAKPQPGVTLPPEMQAELSERGM